MLQKQILVTKTNTWYKKSKELVTKTDYNAKITEIEGKIPNITGLATTTALALVI